MADTGKRRIRSQEILSDIRGGMNRRQLKQKYGLSDRSLDSVFRKLAEAGLLSRAEMQTASVSSPSRVDGSRKDTQTAALKNCPACDARLTSESAECPACGVVVAKYVARRAQQNSARLPVPESGSKTGKKWLLICGVLAIVAVTVGYLLFYHADRSRETPPTLAGIGGPKTSERTLQQSGGRTKTRAPSDHKEKESRQTPNIFAMNKGELLELKFAPEGFPLGLSVTQGSGGIHFFETPDPNQQFKKFPSETDAKRYYDQFTIAGQTFLLLTEGSNPPKIYLDANRNGDMTDDPGPFVGEGPTAAPNHYTLELPYKGEKTAAPYRLWLFPSNMGGIRFYPQCYWEGQIELNGTTYRVVAFDGNADGDYSNDPVVIDADNDGKAAEGEQLKPGESLTIEGSELKLLGVAPSGRWVRVEY